MERKVLTLKELAERWQVNKQTIYNTLNGLPHFRVGKTIRFQLNLIEAYEKGKEICENQTIHTNIETGIYPKGMTPTMVEKLELMDQKEKAYLQRILNKRKQK